MKPIVRILLLLVPLHAAAQTATLAPNSAGTVLGRHVFSAANEDIGLLVDILIGTDGMPRAAIVDVGGFMGVGMRRIAIGWQLLHFTVENGELRIVEDLTHDAAAAAPTFPGPDGSVVVTGPDAPKP